MSVGKVSEYRLRDTTTARLYNFDVNRAELKREHETWLMLRVVPLLLSGGSVAMVGLTSRTGMGEHNLDLSKRRAESILRFLRNQAGNKFKVAMDVGMGEAIATAAGDRDGTENQNWRAVVLSAWNRTDPPPPPPQDPVPPLPSSVFEKVERRVSASFMYEHTMSSGIFSTEPNSAPEKSANAARNLILWNQMKAGGSHFLEQKELRWKTAKVVFITLSRTSSGPALGSTVGGDTLNYCLVQYDWRDEYSSKGPILLSHFKRPGPGEPGKDTGPEAYRLTEAVADLWLRDPPKAWTELRGNQWEKVDVQTVLREHVDSKSR